MHSGFTEWVTKGFPKSWDVFSGGSQECLLGGKVAKRGCLSNLSVLGCQARGHPSVRGAIIEKPDMKGKLAPQALPRQGPEENQAEVGI